MHHLLKVAIVACVIATCIGVAAVFGQVNTAKQDDTAAIRTAARQYLEAKRRGDAEAMRRMWTATGDYVDCNGQVIKPQDLIREQAAAAAPNSAAAEIAVPQSSLRLITPEVAIEDGTSEFGTTDDGATLTGRFTAVWVKREGRWMLDTLRESIAPSPQTHPRLQALAWMLGEWAGKTDDAAILLSAHWSDGGKYILREFMVRSVNGETVVGTQRIGWDPIAGRIKSWTFDSQGGTGEGVWQQEGERWIVKSTEVTADGKNSQTTAEYTPRGDGRFLSEVKNTNLAGTDLQAGRIEFKRAVEDE